LRTRVALGKVLTRNQRERGKDEKKKAWDAGLIVRGRVKKNCLRKTVRALAGGTFASVGTDRERGEEVENHALGESRAGEPVAASSIPHGSGWKLK